MKEVAEYLGNTPTLARSAYVDPRVIDAYERGRTIHATARRRYDTPDERQAALERATLKPIKETLSPMEITVVEGDITQQQVDAVVNAANNRDARWRWRRRRDPPRRWVPRCWPTASSGSPTGSRPATPAGPPPGDLPARWVIHVVGPNRNAGQTDRSAADVVLLPRDGSGRRARCRAPSRSR